MQNQAVIQDVENVQAELMELAKQRNEALLSELNAKNYDGYLTPLVYQSPDGDRLYGIQLP